MRRLYDTAFADSDVTMKSRAIVAMARTDDFRHIGEVRDLLTSTDVTIKGAAETYMNFFNWKKKP
jgi:hypothetical protein